MYVFDTNVYITLGNYYPKRFPTIWARLDELANNSKLVSPKEVYHELDNQSAHVHINEWIKRFSYIFKIPTDEECDIVSQIFQNRNNLALVKTDSLRKGRPVADPFVIALAKINNFYVVTQEAPTRMPKICSEHKVKCINLESFLERENLEY
jgi:hypothetical protein